MMKMMPNNKQLKTYQSLSLQELAIPQRSTLYSLKPLGIGTPLSESLTSYITRLAEAHCVSLGDLLLTTIAPLLEIQFNADVSRRSIGQVLGSSIAPRALNGRGKQALRMTQAIENLTLREDLDLLTLLHWTNVLSDKGLLRSTKAWCPLCFQAWREQTKLVHDPLIWFVHEVKICSIHQTFLQTVCPFCHKTSNIIGWKTRLGHCLNCQHWLGCDSISGIQSQENCNTKAGLENEIEFGLWTAQNIGEVISCIPSMPTIFSRETLTNSLRMCIDNSGGVTPFSREINKSYTTIKRWYEGKEIPKLDSIIYLCYRSKISLLAFLSGEIDGSFFGKPILQEKIDKDAKRPSSRYIAGKRMKPEEIRQALLSALEENPPLPLKEVLKRLGFKSRTVIHNHSPELCKRIAKRYADFATKKRRDELRQKINFIIEENEEIPPSLQEVCRRVNVNNTTLYIHFPDLCEVVTTRRKNYLNLRKNNRIDNLKKEVKQAAIKLHEQGIRPTSEKVALLLSKPGLLRDKTAVEALYEIQKQLGYRR